MDAADLKDAEHTRYVKRVGQRRSSWKFNFGPYVNQAVDAEQNSAISKDRSEKEAELEGMDTIVENADGYVAVSSTTIYDERRGYGFEPGSLVYEKQRMEEQEAEAPSSGKHYPPQAQVSMSARLRAGFCIPLKASFVIDVPDGTYQVLLIAGDLLADTLTRVKAGKVG